jgi:2-oxoisovalerate dehydrogenase E1 component
MTEGDWDEIRARAEAAVAAALKEADARPVANPETVVSHLFYEGEMQTRGGQWTHGYRAPSSTEAARPDGPRITMAAAIRRTLDQELALNPRMLLFGEDIGPKGGVHGVTQGFRRELRWNQAYYYLDRGP